MPAPLAPVNQNERRWLAWLALGLILLTSAPLLYGWWRTPPGHEFTGVHFANFYDNFVYYSYLEQVRQGHWLFFDLFAPVAHQPVFNWLWLVVGLLGKLLGAGNVVTFNLARVLLIPVFLWVAYRFISLFFDQVRVRKLAILIFTFGGGLGVLLLDRLIRFPSNFELGAIQWPMDLWVPEAFTFLTLLYSPHFIASLTLILLVMDKTLRHAITGRWQYSVGAGLATGALFLFHPFHVLSVLGVVGVYAVALMVQRRAFWNQLRHLLIVGLGSAPAILYYLWLLLSDELTRQKALQNLTLTPPLWIVLFSYGLLLLFGVQAISLLLRRKTLEPPRVLLICWVIVQFAALYFPVAYQRRMSAGLQFPLSVLTMVSLVELAGWARGQGSRLATLFWNQRYLAAGLLALLLGSSSLFALSVDVYLYSSQRPAVYLSQDVALAARWLASTPAGSVTFNSSDRKVNVLPAFSGRPVYSGHGVETPNFLFRERQIEWFFSRNRDAQVERAFLGRRGIVYVWWGPTERALGDWQPEGKPYLKPVYHNTSVSIYQIK